MNKRHIAGNFSVFVLTIFLALLLSGCTVIIPEKKTSNEPDLEPTAAWEAGKDIGTDSAAGPFETVPAFRLIEGSGNNEFPADISGVMLYGDDFKELTGKNKETFIEIMSDVVSGEQIMPKENSPYLRNCLADYLTDKTDKMPFEIFPEETPDVNTDGFLSEILREGFREYSVYACETEAGPYLEISNELSGSACYAWSEELEDFYRSIFPEGGRLSEDNRKEEWQAAEAERNEGFFAGLAGESIECKMPETDEDCIGIAQKILEQHIRKISEDGRISGDAEVQNPWEIYLHRVYWGSLDHGLEFVAPAAIDTDGVILPGFTEDDSMTTESGTELFAVCAKYRFTDGRCTLVEVMDPWDYIFGEGGNLPMNGTGGKEKTHPDFFSFLGDEAFVEKLLSDYDSERFGRFSSVVSHNVVMMLDGSPLFIDIGVPSDEAAVAGNGKTGGRMWQDLYVEDWEEYFSPVHFINGEGAAKITYSDGFRLTFDDYNHDGEPDYAIRISSDEGGSWYCVECKGTNKTGRRAAEGETYIPGCFEDSPRLQMSDDGNLLVKSENGMKEETLFPVSSQFLPVSVKAGGTDADPYRMYSEKLVFPGELRNDDGSAPVRFCFWNNTEQDVTLKTMEVQIEASVSGSWQQAGAGLLTGDAVIPHDSFGMLELSLEALKGCPYGLYRIKLPVGETLVYGGFVYGPDPMKSIISEKTDVLPEDISLSFADIPAGSRKAEFTVENRSIRTICLESARLSRAGEVIYEKAFTGKERILEREMQAGFTIKAEETEGGFPAGEYTLELTRSGGGKDVQNLTIKNVGPEERYFFTEIPTAQPEADHGFSGTGPAMRVRFQNRKWTGESVSLREYSELYSDELEVFKNGSWKPCANYLVSGIQPEDPIQNGEFLSLLLSEYDIPDEAGKAVYGMWLYDTGETDSGDPETEILRSQIETFLEAIYSDAESGDLLRYSLDFEDGGQEFIYFRMP